jgi:hypothetical protein
LIATLKQRATVDQTDIELEGAGRKPPARKTWDFKYTSDDKMLEVIAARRGGK